MKQDLRCFEGRKQKTLKNIFFIFRICRDLELNPRAQFMEKSLKL